MRKLHRGKRRGKHGLAYEIVKYVRVWVQLTTKVIIALLEERVGGEERRVYLTPSWEKQANRCRKNCQEQLRNKVRPLRPTLKRCCIAASCVGITGQIYVEEI